MRALDLVRIDSQMNSHVVIDDQPAVAAAGRRGSVARAAQVHPLVAAHLLHADHLEAVLAAAAGATCEPPSALRS